MCECAITFAYPNRRRPRHPTITTTSACEIALLRPASALPLIRPTARCSTSAEDRPSHAIAGPLFSPSLSPSPSRPAERLLYLTCMRPKNNGSPRGFIYLLLDILSCLVLGLSILDPRPSTLDPQPSTLDPRPSTLEPSSTPALSRFCLQYTFADTAASIQRPASTRLAAAIHLLPPTSLQKGYAETDLPPPTHPPYLPLPFVQLQAVLARARDDTAQHRQKFTDYRGCLVIRSSRPRLTLRNKAQKVAGELLEGARNTRNARGPV
jgi:hypothetical protein